VKNNGMEGTADCMKNLASASTCNGRSCMSGLPEIRQEAGYRNFEVPFGRVGSGQRVNDMGKHPQLRMLARHDASLPLLVEHLR
jgi:hypothetical protein